MCDVREVRLKEHIPLGSLTLASHFYMIAIKNPLVGVGWSLCKLSHILVDFVEVRD